MRKFSWGRNWIIMIGSAEKYGAKVDRMEKKFLTAKYFKDKDDGDRTGNTRVHGIEG